MNESQVWAIHYAKELQGLIKKSILTTMIFAQHC